MSEFEDAINIDVNNHINLLLEIQPNSQKNEVSGYNSWRNRIGISIKSRPVKGEANHSLISYLSELFGCVSSDLSITTGLTSRQKTVQIRNVSKFHIMEILNKKIQ